MKGQVFLLTAGIVIGVLVALKAFSVVQQISSEKEILDLSIEDLAFKNVENEMKRLTGISADTPRAITDNIINFINFTRSGSYDHALDFQSLFVGVLANSTNQTMNITVFQFLRETNLNVSLRLNTSSPQTNSTLLNDSATWINNFTFTAGDRYDLTITLPDKSYEENLTITTKNNKDTYTGFFDVRLISERADHVDKFEQEIKIS